MYGTPRVLQSIAGQNVIPGINCLQRGVRRLLNQDIIDVINYSNIHSFTERTEQSSHLRYGGGGRGYIDVYRNGSDQHTSTNRNDAFLAHLRVHGLRLLCSGANFRPPAHERAEIPNSDAYF